MIAQTRSVCGSHGKSISHKLKHWNEYADVRVHNVNDGHSDDSSVEERARQKKNYQVKCVYFDVKKTFFCWNGKEFEFWRINNDERWRWQWTYSSQCDAEARQTRTHTHPHLYHLLLLSLFIWLGDAVSLNWVNFRTRISIHHRKIRIGSNSNGIKGRMVWPGRKWKSYVFDVHLWRHLELQLQLNASITFGRLRAWGVRCSNCGSWDGGKGLTKMHPASWSLIE